MARTGTNTPWILSTLIVTGLSLLFAFEWHSSRKESKKLADLLIRSNEKIEHNNKLGSMETKSKIQRLITINLKLSEQFERLVALMSTEAVAAGEIDETLEPIEGKEEELTLQIEKELESLPPLPEGFNPQLELQNIVDIETILDDPRFNPENKTLSRLDKMIALNELKNAKAEFDRIEGSKMVKIVGAMEVMREREEYIEYGPGEAPEAVPGVLAVGDQAEDGGMNIYMLYPDEYPEIYDDIKLQKQFPELAFRRVLAMVNDQYQ